ncbi:dihydrolipoamide acetyltransferase family protein [Pelagibius sp. Alg239-R121]|uniref:dihydrolipoamide acetyltransferase family protein n=1 Tax=Pelagibius sp. Alg239-R121 TaxID=2993448 RepID=UPI0024A6E95D|nr:dihydrolipoamide acetyltransferase family protein [Pelagibius sp. Alg239-R121]
MAKPIVMPQVGQDLTEGELIEWHVQVGDIVKKGDILAVVESEKASFEVEAYEEGTVLKRFYEPGDMAIVLEPLLMLGEKGETVEEASNAAQGNEVSRPNKSEESVQSADNATGDRPASTTRSSPLARRIAALNKLDISSLKGTGPKGAIVKRDVEAALKSAEISPASTKVAIPPSASQPLPAPTSDEDVEQPFNKMRQVIANRLLESKQTIPHFYLMAEADITDLQIRRKAHLDITGGKISLNDVIVHATALTLLEYPDLNSFVSNTGVLKKAQVNIGVAVSVENGLMVPAIENTPHKSLEEISSLIRDYAAAARRGIDKSPAKSTFSISNLGMYGVEVLPIINLPEAGILGVGPTRRSVMEHRGGFQARDIMSLSLAADHRAVDGAYGAQFLKSLVETIEAYNEFV